MSNTPDNIRNMWEEAAKNNASSLALVRKQREEADARKAAKLNASSLALVRKQREEADARKAAKNN